MRQIATPRLTIHTSQAGSHRRHLSNSYRTKFSTRSIPEFPSLPTSSLHTRQVPSHRFHSKIELHFVSIQVHPFTNHHPPGRRPYSSHFEIAQHTTPLASHDTSVANLRRPRIRMHLGELQLGFGADARRECSVADNVSKSLSTRQGHVSIKVKTRESCLN